MLRTTEKILFIMELESGFANHLKTIVELIIPPLSANVAGLPTN